MVAGVLTGGALFGGAAAAGGAGIVTRLQAGNKEKGFEYLEKAYQRREWVEFYLQVAPDFDSLRGDPRFDDMVKRAGLK